MIGAGLVTAGLIANLLLGSKNGAGPSGGKWIKGGFNAKMDKKEAAQILGLRETALTKAKVKEAHRRMMIANHPDRGGAPYLASSKSSPISHSHKRTHTPFSDSNADRRTSILTNVSSVSTEINEAKDLLDKVVTR